MYPNETKIGHLTILGKSNNELIEFNGSIKQLYFCKCDCGKEIIVPSSYFSYFFRNKESCSCGCAKKKKNKSRSNFRLHHVYNNMINRCYNPKSKDYKYYGGRGIGVCDEWRYSYQEFKEWAYNNGYDEKAPPFKCTIDRIDNDKGYSPDNCRWVDMKIQNRNKRPCNNNKREELRKS